MGSRNQHGTAGTLGELCIRLQRLLRGRSGLLVVSTPLAKHRRRILRIDALERRDLFAVLSGLVYEDTNGDNRFDPSVDTPAAQQLVFFDQNGNSLLDAGERTAYSDASGIAEFQLDFGTWGVILPAPRLQDTLASIPGPTLRSEIYANLADAGGYTLRPAGYAALSVAAFDTVFRGEEAFSPAARLAGGLTDWLVVPSVGEGENDLDQSGILVITKALNENESSAQEVGEILFLGEVPPESWNWWVSDERFEVVGNKIFTKPDHPIDYEREPEIVMVVEGLDTAVTGPNSSNATPTTITVPVLDRNDAPTGIQLHGQTVVERVMGATVGSVEVLDQDLGEAFEYAVSDSRFEIVGGILKLRSDVALFFNVEPFVELTISARSLFNTSDFIEAAVRIDVLPNSAPWTNSDLPLDVNADGIVNSTDALIIINVLNTAGGSLVLPPIAHSRTTRGTPDYVDVNGDGHVGAIDALIVINRLRRGNSLGTAGDGNDNGTTGAP